MRLRCGVISGWARNGKVYGSIAEYKKFFRQCYTSLDFDIIGCIMDSVDNPFSPNAGSRPPELAGRDDILEMARVMMARTQLRRSAQSILMTGLRGVGKTVVLNEVFRSAEQSGNIIPVYIEASENRKFGELLAAPLKMELLKLCRVEGMKAAACKGLSVLRNFLGTIKIVFGDVGIELENLPGEGDTGDMQYDLRVLLSVVAEAAMKRGKAVILMIDAVQYLSREELESLVMAMHHMQQRSLPMAMIGAGLPVMARLAGEAKSYAERLFRYPEIGALPEDDVRRAIGAPFGASGVGVDPEAMESICRETGGYPFFIQEWGSSLWNFIDCGPVTVEDVKKVRSIVLDSLDANFFRIRMERTTPSERRFMYAMAECADGDGRCRLADAARALGMAQRALSPCRASLIRKGMAYGSGHGVISFTVPMFTDFLKRNPNL